MQFWPLCSGEVTYILQERNISTVATRLKSIKWFQYQMGKVCMFMETSQKLTSSKKIMLILVVKCHRHDNSSLENESRALWRAIFNSEQLLQWHLRPYRAAVHDLCMRRKKITISSVSLRPNETQIIQRHLPSNLNDNRFSHVFSNNCLNFLIQFGCESPDSPQIFFWGGWFVFFLICPLGWKEELKLCKPSSGADS